MNTIINKLYYGELCPCEKPAPQTKRCIENRAIICDTEAKLIEQFPKCKELLDTYSDALHVEAQLECEEYSKLFFARWDHEMLDRIMYEMKTASDYVHEHGQYPSGWNSIMETYRLLRQQEEQQKQQSAPKPETPKSDTPDQTKIKPKQKRI